MRDRTTESRGQAITLEGFIGAMVVLMGVLLALQSVVISPTTGGAVDRSVQAQLQQEAQDTLVVAESESFQNAAGAGELSQLLRYVNTTGDEFWDANQSRSDEDHHTYTTDTFEDLNIDLADVLSQRFTEQGWNYNLEVVYDDGSGVVTREIVYQGQPNQNAFRGTYVVTLYNDQPVLDDSWSDSGSTVSSDTDYFIPDGGLPDPVYNVVEVRLVVW